MLVGARRTIYPDLFLRILSPSGFPSLPQSLTSPPRCALVTNVDSSSTTPLCRASR